MLVLLVTGDAYLVDLRREFQGRVELVEEVDEEEELSNRSAFLVQFDSLYLLTIEPVHSAALTVARFDPSGRYIFVGTSQGTILVFNTRIKTVCLPPIKINGLLTMYLSSSLDTKSWARVP